MLQRCSHIWAHLSSSRIETHLKCRRHLLNPPTDLLAPFLAIAHAVRECSGVSTPTVSVGITKCGVRLQGNALMAAVTRETTAWETTARVGRGDYRPADKLMSPTNYSRPRV